MVGSPNIEPAVVRTPDTFGGKLKAFLEAAISSQQSASSMTTTTSHAMSETTVPAMKSPPGFFSALPNELIARILDAVDRADLRALRLVSKLIHGNSINRFATEFFEDVPIIISRESLNSLVDIAAHEVFGPYVKSITLNSMQVYDRLSTSSNRSELWDPRKTLERSGDALQLLIQSLQSLENHGNGIRFTLDDSECRPPNRSYVQYCKDVQGSTLDLMFRAATNSRCNIQALKFHIENEYILIGKLHQSALIYVCSSLLTIDFTYHCLSGICLMINILVLGTKLQNIDIAFGRDNSKDDPWHYLGHWQYFAKCAEAVSTPCLSTLRLANLAVREEDCLGLLAKSCTSLQTLKLEDCVLWHGGCWMRVFTWIRNRLSLETLEIHGLYKCEDDGGELRRVVKNDKNWKFKGADQVGEGLDGIIRQLGARGLSKDSKSQDDGPAEETADPL